MTAGCSVLLGWLVQPGARCARCRRSPTAARGVSHDTLDERIALEGPERRGLEELADTFDEMLERLSGAFASQRRFVANASHELRTPLTVMRTELVTLADPQASDAELRSMAEAVHAALDRTERLVQSLLTLARSEGAITRRDPLDLAGAARTALEHTAREADATGLTVTADLHPAPVAGDRRLLERLVANLVENAVTHNHPGGRMSGHRLQACATGAVSSRSSTTATCPSTPLSCPDCSSRSSASIAAPAATAPASASRSCARWRRRTEEPWRSPCAQRAACAPPVTLPRRELPDPTHPDNYSRERAHA